jgi:hypothetical protein
VVYPDYPDLLIVFVYRHSADVFAILGGFVLFFGHRVVKRYVELELANLLRLSEHEFRVEHYQPIN